MAFFKASTPAYYGDGALIAAPRCETGIFAWVERLLGFPKRPAYLPADPAPEQPIDPCAPAPE